MSELKLFEYNSANSLDFKPKNLVIFLHGYGANGENLLSLAHEFRHTVPEAHFISPNAAESWEGGFPNCYQWFSLYDQNMQRKPFDETMENIIKSNDKLSNFIDQQLDRFNLNLSDLFLIGFSQGAMMSIYQSLVRKTKVKAVISYSGRVILPELTGKEILSRPDICLIHGRKDMVVPFEHFEEGKKILAEKLIPFEAYPIDELDHSIDKSGIRYASNFINKFFKN